MSASDKTVDQQFIEIVSPIQFPRLVYTPREYAEKALYILGSRLGRIISQRLDPYLDGLTWPQLLSKLDRYRGKTPSRYTNADLAAQLRVISEGLGSLGYPFDDDRLIVSALGCELRVARNRVTHMDDMDFVDAWRAVDSVVRLLTHFEDDAVQEVMELRDDIMRFGDVLPGDCGLDAVNTTLEERENAGRAGERTGNGEVAGRDGDNGQRCVEEAAILDGQGLEYDPWVQVQFGDAGVLNDYRERRNQQAIQAVIAEVVEHEGPVSEQRVLEVVGRAFGLQRLEAKHERIIYLQVARTEDVKRDQDGFLWPNSIDQATWREFRPYRGGAFRRIERISPYELANAARAVKAKHPDEGIETLSRRVMQTFGFTNMTESVKAQLSRCWALLPAGLGSVLPFPKPFGRRPDSV